jgi:hypothetical protein
MIAHACLMTLGVHACCEVTCTSSSEWDDVCVFCHMCVVLLCVVSFDTCMNLIGNGRTAHTVRACTVCAGGVVCVFSLSRFST